MLNSTIVIALNCAVLAGIGSSAFPETSAVELRVGEPLPRAGLLKAGIHRYARYNVNNGARELVDIWTRQVSYELVGGRRQLHLRQRWDAADKSYVALFDQTFEANTLKPLSQAQTVTHDGKTKTLTVRFDDTRVDSVGDGLEGAAKPLHEVFKIPFYNWHADMEFLQTLPLRDGYVASIPFYDVGLEPPRRYFYRVVGDEAIKAPDGTSISCWKVDFKENASEPTVHFWFAKRSQTLLREEVQTKDNGKLVKTLLSPEAGDNP